MVKIAEIKSLPFFCELPNKVLQVHIYGRVRLIKVSHENVSTTCETMLRPIKAGAQIIHEPSIERMISRGQLRTTIESRTFRDISL